MREVRPLGEMAQPLSSASGAPSHRDARGGTARMRPREELATEGCARGSGVALRVCTAQGAQAAWLHATQTPKCEREHLGTAVSGLRLF
jgi:hypothetical protein